MERNEVEKQAKLERRARERIKRLAPKVAEAAVPIWREGDGQGGEVQRILDRAFLAVGLEVPKRRRQLALDITANDL